jgi:FdhD protein
MYKVVPCIKEEAGVFTPSTHEVIEEIPLAITINGRHALTVMMSPHMIREFVAGLLFTERIIHDAGEIESVHIEPGRVSVLTTNPFKILVSKKTVLSGCGGSSSYLDVGKLPRISSDLVLEAATIQSAVRETLRSDIHEKTGGIHIIGLYGEKGAILITEDIGRHNALDKVIGYGLLNVVQFSRTFVVSSGRISSEMVRKCLIAGIPLLVSRSATTTLAIETAEKANLTVVAFARGQKMNIYTHHGRVKGSGAPV